MKIYTKLSLLKILKITGFISYSHADGVDLTLGLSEYVERLISDFNLIYDEHIGKGEKLEKIIEKLSQCKILIIVITPAALTSSAMKEEIEYANQKGMKIIPCKEKSVQTSWEDLPWGLDQCIGFDFEGKYELRRKLVSSLSNPVEKLRSETKPVRTKIDSSKENEDKVPSLVIMIDKSYYMYNTDMICTIISPKKISTIPIDLKIFNENKELVYKNTIPIQPSKNGIYQEVILISGDRWISKPGSQYFLIAEHEGRSASLEFFIHNPNIAIELDQKVYTWTDMPYITIVAPELVNNPEVVETIGNNKNSSLSISTSKGTLSNYELMETGPGTGVFSGQIQLTGFIGCTPLGDTKIPTTMGETRGYGPIGDCYLRIMKIN